MIYNSPIFLAILLMQEACIGTDAGGGGDEPAYLENFWIATNYTCMGGCADGGACDWYISTNSSANSSANSFEVCAQACFNESVPEQPGVLNETCVAYELRVNDTGARECKYFSRWDGFTNGGLTTNFCVPLRALVGGLTESPTKDPTASPSESTTRNPTESPTESPTKAPTASPTENPTGNSTESPTESPTKAPTASPTESPTSNSTESPTRSPTESPTRSPTENPTRNQTESPTRSPTENPTRSPTESPTRNPTENPTRSPTESPTGTPTGACEVRCAKPNSASCLSCYQAMTVEDWCKIAENRRRDHDGCPRETSKNMTSTWIAVAVGAVFILAMIGVGFYLIKKKKTQPEKPAEDDQL